MTEPDKYGIQEDASLLAGAWGKIKEYPWAAIGTLVALAVAVPDVREGKISVSGMFGLFFATFFYLVEVVRKRTASQEKVALQLRILTEKFHSFDAALANNTRVLRTHEQLLESRTADQLTLISFKNLLAYLPFYLAEDLGYFQDEHISITTTIPSLNDKNTARLLLQNPKTSIAICDPYMCLIYQGLELLYPICSGVAAWPMTLNWIGSNAASEGKIQIATYDSPSTSYVLANLVASRLITPRLGNGSKILPRVVELKDKEARFGESEILEDVSEGLSSLLMQYDVLMLWEPHCEMALKLGARYLFSGDYEKSLRDFGPSLLYSGLVISQELGQDNPTLPIRLRRALDRAIARLQDPDRLPYCRATLERRRLLSGFEDQACEQILDKLAKSLPKPSDSVNSGSPGWSAARASWAAGLFAANNLRKTLVQNQPDLAEKLAYRDLHYTNAGDYLHVIWKPQAMGG